MKKLLTILMTFCLIVGIFQVTSNVSAADPEPAGYVAVSVDASVLGAGYLYEPMLVPFYEGENYAQVFDRFIGSGNYQSSGTLTSGFYLTGIKLPRDITVALPDVIFNEVDDTFGELDPGPAEAGSFLKMNDYLDMCSGWMFTVNNEFASAGADSVYPENGEVCRWQFSLFWGSDIGTDWWGYEIFVPAEKTALTWRIAQINSSPDKEDILSRNEVYQVYVNANKILEDLTATQTQINDVLTTMNTILFEQFKIDAKAELDSYKRAENYRPLQQKELADAIAAGKIAIDMAVDVSGVNIAVENAKNFIDTIKTDEQLTIEEGSGVKPVDSNYKAALNDVLAYLTVNVSNPAFGSVGGEWTILALARSGYNVPEGYFENYLADIIRILNENDGILPDSSSRKTEYSRLIIALAALGVDVTNISGYNLLEPLSDFEQITKQGISGAIYALIALDTNKWEVPAVADSNNQTTRQKLIDYILSHELENGGFTFSGTDIDPDLTAMALQALAKYKNDDIVKLVIDRALLALSDIQLSNGGFSSWGSENVESVAQVITALTALGIDPAADSRFIKENGNLITALLAFQKNGGFEHETGGGVNQMATEQAAYALVAYDRFVNGENILFDMSDVKETVKPGEEIHPDENIVPPDVNTDQDDKVTEKPINPDTSDKNNLYTAIVVMPISITAAIILFLKKKKIAD